MLADEKLYIWIEGYNGKIYNIAGPPDDPDWGKQGVRLATEGHGLEWDQFFETQIETIYNSTAFEIGGRYGGLREKMFEFSLAFHIKPTADTPWRIVESRFRKAMGFKKDFKIHVKVVGQTTSHRWLNVRLRVTPKVKVQTDPMVGKYGLALVTFVAPYPRWLAEDYVEEHTTQVDTRTTGTETIWFTEYNPTNNEVWKKWFLQAGNEGVIYTLPDFSHGDDRFDLAEEHEDRMVVMPELMNGEHVAVDTDELTMQGQVNSSLDTQVYQRMNNREFLYPLPEYMPEPVQVPVVVTGADIGNKVVLRIPREWGRPWGLE